MKRITIGVAVIALAVLTCGEIQRQRSIQGNVVGADGKVPPAAHVHLLELGDAIRNTVESAKVGEEGSFTMELPGEGYYELLVTAVNHRPLRIPLVSDNSFALTGVVIKPVSYHYKVPLEEVRIIGDWDDFSWGGAEPMTRHDDGTFTHEREITGDTLAYQLLDVEISGRSINGTDSDYYVYDGGGDYLSVVSVEGGTARITFDPGQAAMVSTQDLPLVDFGEQDRTLAEVWKIHRRWQDEAEQGDRAFEEYREKEGTHEGFEYDMSSAKQYLMGGMAMGEDPVAKRYAAVTMAGILELGLSLDQEELATITELVPVTDGLWALQPVAFPEVFRQAYGHDKMMELFEAHLDEVVQDKVRAAMLLELGLEAKTAGDTARQRGIYDDLIKNHPDVNVPYISYRIETQLDPDLRVAAGKPVPEFELVLLDEKGMASNQSMLGKHYLIDFWATWCGPCLRELDRLHSAHVKYGDYAFEMLSISLDREVDDIDTFRAGDWKMPWLHASVEGGFESDICTQFEVSGIPKPILVDPQGKILAVGPDLRGDRLEETLEEHLGN